MANSWFTEHPEISLDHMDLNVSIQKVKAYDHPHIKKKQKSMENLKLEHATTKKNTKIIIFL